MILVPVANPGGLVDAVVLVGGLASQYVQAGERSLPAERLTAGFLR